MFVCTWETPGQRYGGMLCFGFFFGVCVFVRVYVCVCVSRVCTCVCTCRSQKLILASSSMILHFIFFETRSFVEPGACVCLSMYACLYRHMHVYMCLGGVCVILDVHVWVCVHERGPNVNVAVFFSCSLPYFMGQEPGQHRKIQAGQMHGIRQKKWTETNWNMGPFKNIKIQWIQKVACMKWSCLRNTTHQTPLTCHIGSLARQRISNLT